MNCFFATILILLAANLAFAEGSDSRTEPTPPPEKRLMSEGLFFSSITISNDSVLATMPLTQNRFLSFINGTNSGIVSSSHLFALKSGDRLNLADKHRRITAIPTVTATNAELVVIQVFDGRSFGDSVKTNIGTIKLK